MFLLAHVGVTMAAARVGLWVWQRVQENGQAEARGSGENDPPAPSWPERSEPGVVDFRLVGLGSLAPDLIDKSLGLGIVLLGAPPASSRMYGHTLLFALLLLLAATFFPRLGRPLWLGLFLGDAWHLLLDGMWRARETLWWPLYGLSFPPETLLEGGQAFVRYWQAFLTDRFIQGTEMLGAFLLLTMLVRLLIRRRLHRFLREGKL